MLIYPTSADCVGKARIGTKVNLRHFGVGCRQQTNATAVEKLVPRPTDVGGGNEVFLDHPAMAIGTALLLGIWMSISSVDMVSPRSIETCR